MTASATPRPRPAAVVELVVRLLGSPWPRTEADRIAWFQRHRLAAEPAEPAEPASPGAPRERADGGERSASYLAAGPASWDGTPIGWHTFDGEFVGVHWFLWRGLTREDMRVAAADLRAGFRRAFGPPADELDRTAAADPWEAGFTACWHAGGRTIDCSYHPGGHPPGSPGPEETGATVRLHVDHTARADAQEASARAR